jgi:hypothetical protein
MPVTRTETVGTGLGEGATVGDGVGSCEAARVGGGGGVGRTRVDVGELAGGGTGRAVGAGVDWQLTVVERITIRTNSRARVSIWS